MDGVLGFEAEGMLCLLVVRGCDVKMLDCPRRVRIHQRRSLPLRRPVRLVEILGAPLGRRVRRSFRGRPVLNGIRLVEILICRKGLGLNIRVQNATNRCLQIRISRALRTLRPRCSEAPITRNERVPSRLLAGLDGATHDVYRIQSKKKNSLCQNGLHLRI